MKQRFDVTTLESCERDFMNAKSEMSLYDWHIGGYEALYNSCRKRLLKKQENLKIKLKK